MIHLLMKTQINMYIHTFHLQRGLETCETGFS